MAEPKGTVHLDVVWDAYIDLRPLVDGTREDPKAEDVKAAIVDLACAIWPELEEVLRG